MTSNTRIANRHLTVDISSVGSEMQAVTTADGRSWLWNGDATFWTGRSPVLFPMVGKAPNNHIEVDGRSYEMAQHGFARRSEFTLTVSSPTACRYELAASENTRTVYPFEFLLAVEHALDDARLTVSADVENRDARPMPFGLGFHPAFLWPLPGSEGQAHTVTLDNHAEPALTQLEDGLVKQEKLPSPFRRGELTLRHELFENDALIFAEGAGRGLTYAAANGTRLKFSFENLPNLALWQKLGAPFLCIEPWHGTAAEHGGSSELAARPYAVILQPGERTRFSFTVEFPV
jgi:galactose mutarotase-like enzyme